MRTIYIFLIIILNSNKTYSQLNLISQNDLFKSITSQISPKDSLKSSLPPIQLANRDINQNIGSGSFTVNYYNTYYSNEKSISQLLESPLKIAFEQNKYDSLYYVMSKMIISDSSIILNTSKHFYDLFEQTYTTNFPQSIVNLKKSIHVISNQRKFFMELCHRYSVLSKVYLEKGFNDSSNHFLILTKELLNKETVSESRLKSRILYNLAQVYEKKGELDLALYYCNQALVLSKLCMPETDFFIIDRLFFMGWLFDKKTDFQKSIEFYRQALEIISLHPKSDTLEYKASILHNLGWEYGKIKKFHVAKKYYHESLKIVNKSRDTISMINTFGNLGYIYFSLLNYDSSLVYFQKINKIDNYSDLRAIYMQGLNYYYLNRDSFAKTFFLSALENLKEHDNNYEYEWIQGYSNYFLSRLLLEEHKLKDALDYSFKSLKYKSSINEQSDVYYTIAEVYQQMGNNLKAIEYIDSCLLYLNEDTFNIKQKFDLRLKKAFIYLNENDLKNLDFLIDNLLKHTNKSNSDKIKIFNILAQKFALKNELDSALLYFEFTKNISENEQIIDTQSYLNIIMSIGDIYINKYDYIKALDHFNLAKKITQTCDCDNIFKSKLDFKVLNCQIQLQDFTNASINAEKYLAKYKNELIDKMAIFYIYYIKAISSKAIHDTTNYKVNCQKLFKYYNENSFNVDTLLFNDIIYSLCYISYCRLINKEDELLNNVEKTISLMSLTPAKSEYDIIEALKISYFLEALNYLIVSKRPEVSKLIYSLLLKSVSNFQKQKNEISNSIIYSEIGNYFRLTNSPDSTLIYFEKSINSLVNAKIKNPFLITVMLEKSNVLYYYFKQKKKAHRIIDEAIQIYEEIKMVDFNLLSNAYRDKGYFFLDEGEYEKATIYFSKCIDLSPQKNIDVEIDNSICKLIVINDFKLKSEYNIEIDYRYNDNLKFTFTNYLYYYLSHLFYDALKYRNYNKAELLLYKIETRFISDYSKILRIILSSQKNDLGSALGQLEMLFNFGYSNCNYLESNQFLNPIKTNVRYRKLIQQCYYKENLSR